MPNEETSGNAYDKEEKDQNILDKNNDIKTEKIDNNFENKKEEKDETNKIEEKLIYPIFKLNKYNSDKEDKGKYYINL